nr:unnamed protein product [Callosobruchus analis]
MDMPMQGDAFLLKEKIIKTDTLLQKYQENLTKLKKATELCKYLKKKYGETKQTLEISQLENERTKFKLENIQSKHQELGTENTKLSNELSNLGEHYLKYNLETQSTIKSLQDELTMLKEMKQYNPDADKKIKCLEAKLKKLQAVEKQYKAEMDNLSIQQNKIYEKHEEEKSTLLKQIEKLESQINKNQENNNSKPDFLNDPRNLTGRLSGNNQTITDSNHINDIESANHSGEPNVNLLKGQNDLELATSENATLRHQLNMKNREIAALRIKRATRSVSVQAEKIVNNCKDTCYTELSNFTDLNSESDSNVIVREDSHVSDAKTNKNNISLPVIDNIIKEHSQEVVCETSDAVSIKKLAVSTQTECFGARDLETLNDLKSANAELKQQLNIKNREIAALRLKESESVSVQTEQISNNGEAHTEDYRDYFPDSCSESDFDDDNDAKQQLEVALQAKQSQNNIHSIQSTRSINGKIDETPPESKKLAPTLSANCDMSTQTEVLYTGLLTRKPEIAVISTQTAVKTISSGMQTEHKYVSLSTQTDADDSVSKFLANSIQNDPTASDEESISDIISEMKNIPRLLSPIPDMFDAKIPATKKTIEKANTKFAKRNWRRAINTSRSYSPKYLPWKRRIITKNARTTIVQDSVAKALQILKKAKINFTISNETILPQGIFTNPRYFCSQKVMPQNQPVESNNNFIEKLSCFGGCATNYTHMMLSNSASSTELLGFFKEKKDSATHIKVDIASHTTQRNSNPEHKTDLVDETAKIVISKLKKEFNLFPKKRRKRNLSSSDSDISEFQEGGLGSGRSLKKTKRFQGMNHRKYRQIEETTSGFESCSTPLTQYSTIDSQSYDVKYSKNELQKSLNDISSTLQNIEAPISPLSDITINQICESSPSTNVSLIDHESQKTNQSNQSVQSTPNSHNIEETISCHMKNTLNDGTPEANQKKCDFKLPENKYEEVKISSSDAGTCTEKHRHIDNEETFGCHMKKTLNNGALEVNKEKCDFKLPQNKFEETEINSSDAGTCIEKLRPRKKRKPMGKLKSKTLRQFKQKMLMFQTEHPRVPSVCNATATDKTDDEKQTQNKFISGAPTNTSAEMKSQNGKIHGLMIEENSSEKSAVDVPSPKNKQALEPLYTSKQYKNTSKVGQQDGDSKKMFFKETLNLIPTSFVDSFELGSIEDKNELTKI